MPWPESVPRLVSDGEFDPKECADSADRPEPGAHMRTPRIAAALMVLPLIGLAACASDDDDATPAATPSATASSSSSGGNIKLMTLTSESGPIVFPEVVGAAKAAAKAVNDGGGVS